MQEPRPGRRQANYGIDAPGVVAMLGLGGTAALSLGLLAYFGLRYSQPVLAVSLINMGCWFGIPWVLTSCVMLYGSKVGKLRLREKVLAGIPWSGEEMVLDVGCGHGLMLLGAARRLRTGRAIGVDLWQRQDQAGNDPEVTRDNARLEGVADRVEVRDGDARQLPFPQAMFDVVFSSWALHNIYDAAGRHTAVREIVRVLRPGGRVIIIDIRHTSEYVQTLRDCGMRDIQRSRPHFLFLIPTFIVSASKP